MGADNGPKGVARLRPWTFEVIDDAGRVTGGGVIIAVDWATARRIALSITAFGHVRSRTEFRRAG